MSLIAYLIPLIVGVLAIRDKLHTIMDKLNKLEKKQDKHNNVMVRLAVVERRLDDDDKWNFQDNRKGGKDG